VTQTEVSDYCRQVFEAIGPELGCLELVHGSIFILFSVSQKVEILYLLSQRKYIKKEPKQNENIKDTVGRGNVG
jgi:hypothetical protein